MLWPWMLLVNVASAQDCPEIGPILDEAERLVVEARIEPAREALARTEAAWACGGPASATDLARAWQLEAALDTFDGDPASATDAFAAAARVAPDLWTDALGPVLEKAWRAAVDVEEGMGRLSITQAPPDVAVIVDGLAVEGPEADLPAGLHLVQAGPDHKDLRFAKVIFVSADETVLLPMPSFELEPEPAAPQPVAPAPQPQPASPEPAEVPPAEPEPAAGVFFHAGLGPAASFGSALEFTDADGQPLIEPSLKLLLPVELGLSYRGQGFFFRVAGTGAPVLSGTLIYADADGNPTHLPVAPGAHAAAGLSLGATDLGLLGGVLLPGRIEARALVGQRFGSSPLRGELRLGANFPVTRGPEPAGGLFLVLDPS